MCHICREMPLEASTARRGLLKLAAGVALSLAVPRLSFAAPRKVPPKPENVLSPDAALDRLLKGNNRYARARPGGMISSTSVRA